MRPLILDMVDFRAKTFNIFYIFGREKNPYIVNSRTDKAKRISDKAG